MEGLNALENLLQLVFGTVFIGVVFVVARGVGRLAKRSEGQGPEPLLGVALGAAVFGGTAWHLWNNRVWHELLRETSTPLVRVLPAGVFCESCRWEGYVAAMSTSTRPLLVGTLAAIVFVVSAWRYRLQAARLKQLRHASLWLPLEIALIAIAMTAMVIVLRPPAGSPGWPEKDARWIALQADELLGKRATAGGCTLFWNKFSSPLRNAPGNAPMPSGKTLESVVSTISSQCLVEAPPEKPPAFAFFASMAWKSASPSAQDAWLRHRTEKVDPCDALATPEVQCVLAGRDHAYWKDHAARCLSNRGCYPYRGETNVVANVLTLGLLGNPSASCEPHKEYLKALAESGAEAPKVSSCEGL